MGIKKSHFTRNLFRLLIFPGFILTTAPACHLKNPPPNPTPNSHVNSRIDDILIKNGVFAEDSLYACLLNALYQGIPLDQASKDCEGKLIEDDKKGFGGDLGNIKPGSAQYFDPAKITSACGNSGDPTRGQTASSSGYGERPGWGNYSWGGDPKGYYGYVKEDSAKLKEEAVQNALAEREKFNRAEKAEKAAGAALNEAKKGGDKAAIKKAEENYNTANEAAKTQAANSLSASEKARADPNKKPKNDSRTVAGESPCEQAMDAARELLRECNRTKWKDARCQQLKAKVGHCPDPTLILVDPESGYACGEKPDPESIKNAWVANCEEHAKYGPDTQSPCKPPTLDKSGRYVRGGGATSDACHDPHAYIDPESPTCQTEIKVGKTFGAIDIHQIIVIALNRIGGPIVILPGMGPKPPKPGVGPEPVPVR